MADDSPHCNSHFDDSQRIGKGSFLKHFSQVEVAMIEDIPQFFIAAQFLFCLFEYHFLEVVVAFEGHLDHSDGQGHFFKLAGKFADKIHLMFHDNVIIYD